MRTPTIILRNATRTVGYLQAGGQAGKARQGAHGADRRQPLDSRISGNQAPRLLPRSSALVRVEPEDHAGVSRHHHGPILVDGVWNGGGALGSGGKDQVL